MTLEQTILRKIEQAFEAWERAGRPGLFRTFLDRKEEGILDVLTELPNVRTTLGRTRDSRKVLAELDKTPPHRAVADNILALYMDAITLAYQQGRLADTFAASLEHIRKECSTAQEVEAYLRRHEQP